MSFAFKWRVPVCVKSASYILFDFSHRDADTDSVNTMVVHEDEGEAGEGEQAGGYGDQTMLVQRVSHLYM